MIEIRPGAAKRCVQYHRFSNPDGKRNRRFCTGSPTVEKGVHAIFDDPHKGAYWIAELDGDVVGCLLTVPEWSDWRNGTVLWIHSVYVIPRARRRGVFRMMYETLKTTVEQSADLRGLRLYVEQENERAQKLITQWEWTATTTNCLSG